MKRFIFSVITMASVCVCADAVQQKAHPDVLGGFVYFEGRGKIAIENYQTDVSVEALQGGLDTLTKLLFTKGEIHSMVGDWSFCTANELKKKSGAQVVVFLVKDNALPMSLISMEGLWSVVNVAALSKDKPTSKVLESRVRKLIGRTIAVMLEIAPSKYPVSCMRRVETLEDLDARAGETLTLDHVVGIYNNMPELGFVRPKKMPYRAACIKQIAPTPTNDIQKAVWNAVEAERRQGKFEKRSSKAGFKIAPIKK